MGQINRKVLEEYFEDAKIRSRFFGGFKVTTPSGGDFEIDSNDHTVIHVGGSDDHANLVRMYRDVFGNVTVDGNPQVIANVIAHGAVEGVPVIPEVKKSGDGCLRYIAVFLAFFIALGFFGQFSDNGVVPFILAIGVAGAVSNAMKDRETRKQRRRGQQYRDAMPRVHGGRREVSRRDAERQGWL